MITLSTKEFKKFAKSVKGLEKTDVYVVSISEDVFTDVSDIIGRELSAGVAQVVIPDNIGEVLSGELSKKQFKKSYKKYLKGDQVRFIMYTIARAVRENHNVPIFVTSEDELKTGFLDILADKFESQLGLKRTKIKAWKSVLNEAWDEAKSSAPKKSKRGKVYSKLVKEAAEDFTEFEDSDKFEELDAEFTIQRLAIFLGQGGERGRKKLISDIKNWADSSKKRKKILKETVKELADTNDLSKKEDRWSTKDVHLVISALYNELYPEASEGSDTK
ncbi:MAG: hypothetical protein ABS873_05695 [Alkalibacterium sp.]